MMREQPTVLRYVRSMKRAMVIFSFFAIPAIMVSMPAIAEEAENIELPLPHLQQAAPAQDDEPAAGGMDAGPSFSE